MKFYLYLILLIVPALALPAEGSIFGKKAHPTPDKRVPELIYTVKSDPDEGKRTAAAGELRDYDAKAFPDMIPVLIDVLQNDTKPNVRREAAISLGRLRPISQDAGKVLQQAAAKDPSLRVRIQAWSSLKMYQLNGYAEQPANSAKSSAPASKTPAPVVTVQPAPGNSKPPAVQAQPAPATQRSTNEPPLADPRETIFLDSKSITTTDPLLISPPPGPQGSVFSSPLPPGPSTPPASNIVPRSYIRHAGENDGPILIPR